MVHQRLVAGESLYDDRRWYLVVLNARRIDNDGTILRRPPQAAVGSAYTGRLHAAVGLATSHTVALGVGGRHDASRATVSKCIQLLAWYPKDSAVGAHPQTAKVILENLVDHFVQQAVLFPVNLDGYRRQLV